ncbi:HD domain-containing phosphohydrolase [Nitrosophilus alvini]|uniref:HD domain-containing phosphohydrolase n=1 Tax=Nitrosophilus alvini TaxID=2714855 RepID=UPI00190CEBE7|nr:HD domain-containing phosphohydrolase [Nitrosophilus alvini]
MKRFFLLLIIYVSVLFPQEYKSLKVCIYEDWPLYYYDEKEGPKGLFVDLLEKIAEKEKFSLEYFPSTLDGCLKGLRKKKFDLLCAVTQTHDRLQYASFAKEKIIENWAVVYAKEKTGIHNIPDLDNRVVALLKGDAYNDKFFSLIREFDIDPKIVYAHSYDEIFTLIDENRVDAGVATRLLFYKIHDKYPSIVATPIIFSPIKLTFAAPKDKKELLNVIDKNIRILKNNAGSEFKRLLEKHLSVTVMEKIPKWVYSVFGIFLIFASVLFLFNLYLKREVDKRTSLYKKEKEKAVKSYKKEAYLRSVINTVRNINQILIENENIDTILKKVCEELAGNIHYKLAWIGIPDGNSVKVAYKSTDNTGYLENSFRVDINPESKFSKGPTGTAYLTKKTVIENTQEDNNFEPWKERAQKSGFTYCMATPLKYKDKLIFGVLTVYTDNKEGFKKEEIAMLEELAGDIGFVLYHHKLAEDKERLLNESLKSYKEIARSMIELIEARDPYTAGHSKRVAMYSEMLAKELGLDVSSIKKLTEAAYLHDIGKIETPDTILLKPGKLNDIEYSIIKKHPETGYKVLSSISKFKELAEIVLYHHERCNSSGYPYGIGCSEIPFLSKILAVADAFDGMTTDRIYKPRKNLENALKELEKAKGILFDEKVVEAALKVFKDVSLQQKIDQLPKSRLEEERFAYFFKDQLTNTYNIKYLEIIFAREETIDRFSYLYLFSLHKFTLFNKTHGWRSGNEFLIKTAEKISSFFNTEKIFRYKGDSFIVLSDKEIEIDTDSMKKLLNIEEAGLELSVKVYNLKKLNINSMDKLHRQILYG